MKSNNWTEEDIGKIIYYENYVFGEKNRVAIIDVDKDMTGLLRVINHPLYSGSKKFYTDVPKKDQQKLDSSYFERQGDYSVVGEASEEDRRVFKKIRESSDQ